MKFVKGISLFIVYPLLLLGIGAYIGIKTEQFFYPGDQSLRYLQYSEEPRDAALDLAENDSAATDTSGGVISEEVIAYAEARAVAATAETLCVDTDYVVLELDVFAGTAEEITMRLPDKYVGMTREQFVEEMDVFEMNPPLAELERGFVDLEVIAFSREKVIVQMNYKFVQPSASFYLAVYDNRVVVYLEDKKTIYIETDILLESLPEELQQDIIEMMYVENEECLYGFLESHSS